MKKLSLLFFSFLIACSFEPVYAQVINPAGIRTCSNEGTGSGVCDATNSTNKSLTFKSIAGTTNQVNITAGENSVTLSTPQNIATTSSPTFAGLQIGSGTVLSAYQEGVWTPTLTFSGASVGITYSTQAGTYTVIGNRVFVQGNITLTSKGTSVGSAQIMGLPFPIMASVANSPAISSRIGPLATTPANTGGYFGSGTSNIVLTYISASGLTNLTNTDFANNTIILFAGSYNK